MSCLAMFGIGPVEVVMALNLLLLLFAVPGVFRIARTASWLRHELSGNHQESKRAEQRVGRDLVRSLLRDMPLDDSPRRTSLVATLGELLTANCRDAVQRRQSYQVDRWPNETLTRILFRRGRCLYRGTLVLLSDIRLTAITSPQCRDYSSAHRGIHCRVTESVLAGAGQ